MRALAVPGKRLASGCAGDGRLQHLRHEPGQPARAHLRAAPVPGLPGGRARGTGDLPTL